MSGADNREYFENWLPFIKKSRLRFIRLICFPNFSHAMLTSAPGSSPPSRVKSILLTGLVAGTLDMSAALLVYTVIMQKVTAVQLLQGIASGIFGKAAQEGGLTMACYGFIFHYIIAFSFTIGYFLVFPRISFLRNHKIISGLLYGVFAWLVMNRIVLPLSNAHMSPFKWSYALLGMSILMLCIGLPISLLTHRYYSLKNKQ
jgi:uncharacterized membrane protein YagU involved in acid resistance